MTRHTNNERHTVERLRRFGSAADANRLELLSAIEQTMDALVSERREVSTLIDNGEMLIESLESSPARTPIDPADEIANQLESLEKSIRSDVLPALRGNRESALADPQLDGDFEDGIVCAYDDLISLWTNLHNTTVNLRWAVMEHEADLDEPTGNTYESPEDLIKHIRQ